MAISAVATVLLVVAITGARRPAQPQARGKPPWPAPASVAIGVRAARLTLNQPDDIVVTRYAVHLEVRVNGQPVPVPARIGVDGPARAPLTTRDSSGLIRVASPAQAPVFTLGQFFDEWQVTLTGTQLGGLRGGTVTTSVNGTRADGDPGAVVLAPHQQIAVSYSSAGGPVPVPSPSPYTFPGGL